MAEQQKKGILCVGMICVDIINVCESFPEEDTDQRSLDYFWRRGGNASNSSTVLSRLGADVELFGTLPKDQKPELEFLQADIRDYGIKSENCPLYGEPYRCPVAIVVISKKTGSRTILAACNHLKEMPFEDFDKLDLNVYSWIHFEGRKNGDNICKMMDKVIAHNASVTESQRIKISFEIEKRNRPELTPLIVKADYVFMSKDVAREKGYDSKETAVTGVISGCKQGSTLICAWGEDGAAALTQGSSLVTSSIFPPDSVVDTVGAGDTFNAATILALSSGKTVHEAITFGCRVAGAKCGAMGYKHLKGMQKFL